MLITLDKYIRSYCVRKKEQITNPPIHDLKEFVLPRSSQLHFLEKDVADSVGILANNPLLKYNDKNKVVSEFIVGYSNDKAGGYKRVTVDTKEPVRSYFRVNKGITNGAHSKSDLLLDKNLVVSNYGLMEEGVTYFKSPYSWWLRFQNRWNSIFENISTSVRSNRRNHFVIIDLPEIFPSVAQFRKFEEDQGNDVVRKIANSERMILCQFWNWFSDDAPSVIPRDVRVLERMYFVFRYHDKWVVFNPLTLKSFMRSANNPRGSLNKLQMQKAFIVMLLSMLVGSVDNLILDEAQEAGDEDNVKVEEEEHIEARRDTIDYTAGLAHAQTQADPSIQSEIAKAFDKVLIEVEDKDEFAELQNKRDKKIDKLLDELEAVNINVVEATENLDAVDQNIVKDDDGKEITASIDKSDIVIDYKEYSPKEINHEEMFKEKLKNYVLRGNITPQQMKRLERLSSRYKEIPDPLTGQSSLEKAAFIDEESLTISKEKKFIDKINMVADESMLKSTLIEMDRKYINEVMQKDIYNAVMSVQRHGIALQNYQIKRVKQLGDEYDVHSVKLVPIEGEPSTITFKVPVVNDNGVFQSRSVKNFMKKQRVDIPIRKVGHDEVALTSDASKMFVERSQFSAYSSEKWLRGQLVLLNNPELKIRWGGSNSQVEGITPADIKKDIALSKRTPLLYSQIARSVKSIQYKHYELFFDASKLEENFGKEVVAAFEETRATQILLGKGKNSLLILTNAGIVHECAVDKKENVEIGPLEEFLGIDTSKKPVDCADISMLRKHIPLGVLLGYYLGLGNLLKTLNVNHHFVPKGTRGVSDLKGHVAIKFSDGTLMVNVKTDYKAQLIVAGFNRYKNFIKDYSVYEFDKPTVYGNVFAAAGLPARFQREFLILRDMWVDPITEAELIRMGEPTDFVLLLIRAAELLEFDQHPPEMERAYQRDRGYERVSGFVYQELMDAIRTFDSNPVKSRAKVSMNPEAVWMRLISDETVAPIEESNPIHNLKETEMVVYRGAGGRSARTMNANARRFTKTAIGVDSEVTVDNGDAGTVRYLSANPNYNSVRGTVNVLDKFDQSVNSSCLNTSSLLAPGATLDDPKRRGFISIQNSRTTNSEGSHISPTRTGYERVIAHRTSDLFATMASEEGTCTRVTENAVVVKYKSGKEVVVELGKRDGKWAGKIIPHNVITNLKEGQKVKAGDAIAFNPMFFEVDVLGGTLAYKSGVLCRVGLVEEEFTYEDSSEISSAFGEKLVTKNCEERFIKVDFTQEVNEFVKVGTQVEYDSILCVLQNNIGGVENAFTQSSLEALRDISSLTPRAKHDGIVTDITAIYAGEFEEMSPSLQNIVSASDRKLYKKARDTNREKVTGQKRAGERIDGKTLEPNTVVIKVTIDITQDMGVGSKLVFGHQMKSVVSNMWNETFCTMDGVPYDAKFSYASFVKRIVESGILTGILNTYCVETSKRACEIYEKG